MELALATFDRWIAAGARHYVCVADVHSVMQGQWQPRQRAILNQAGMVTPDGMPLVWLCRAAFDSTVSRVYGPDLLIASCRHSIGRGYRHFFYGGGQGLAEKLGDILQKRFPGLEVSGSYSPPFGPLSPREEDEVVAMINAQKPHFVWVGLSTPKQEQWMAKFRDRLEFSAPNRDWRGIRLSFGHKAAGPAFYPALRPRMAVSPRHRATTAMAAVS